MIDRINRYVTARFNGVGTTRGSFFRIHVWALGFIVVASVLLPTQRGQGLAARRAAGPVQNLARTYEDQRVYLPSAFAKKKYFHIAWIMASEGLVFDPNLDEHYLATSVRSALPAIDGRPVVVDVYYLPGSFVGDEYLSLLDALAAKPDMVVMSLNPVWTLNPFATHQWMQLDARAAVQLAGKPDQWPLAATALSPSDLLWGVAAARLKPVAQRADWSMRVHDLVDDLGPLDRATLAATIAAQKPPLAQRLLTNLPVVFWLTERIHHPPGSSGVTNSTYWSHVIDVSNTHDNQFNKDLLRAIVRSLKASGIPSYVYVAQVNGDYLGADAAFRHAVGGVEQQLAQLRGAFAARNIRFQPHTPNAFVSGMQFRALDAVHLTDPAGLASHLARELCTLEAQVGKGAACTPTDAR